MSRGKNVQKLTLKPYQVEARSHLLTNPRAALFVGMGMGKTAITISALRELLLDGDIRAALIVAPLRVAVITWPNELKKWSDSASLEIEILRGRKPSGRSQIYLVNYESLHTIQNLNFCDLVVFDELTKAKNPKSERINHIRKLFRHHKRWGLTGTPRPNSLLELYGQLRVLDDGARLGKSFSQFRDTYFTSDYMGFKWTPKPGAKETIYAKIADLALTMRASDYLDIPDLIVEDVEIALPESARSLYRELERELLVALGKEGDVVAQNAATLTNKLLQITGGFVYNETRGVVNVHSAKIDALKKLLKGIDENVLIVTNYIHEREAVVKALGERAVDAGKFKGDIEDAWNSGAIKWLVADPRSFGHGLNLQRGGRTIVWYSPNYSRELYDQCNARLHRSGQQDETLVYRLLCTGTIDEVVVETLHERGEEQGAMLALLANYRKFGIASK